MNCRYYLRSSPQYTLHKQLGDIGSRVRRLTVHRASSAKAPQGDFWVVEP